jgi:Fic family protein
VSPSTEQRLRDLLANWERFLHGLDGADTIDPLVRMAAAHYQFEAIHPFTDGNGRTGRILNILFLVDQKLLPLPILHLSRYIVAHRPDYYRLLLGVTRDEAWEDWLLYMLTAVAETASWTTAKIAAVRELASDTGAFLRRRLPKLYSRELVDVLVARPYVRIGHLVDAQLAGRQAASRWLKALVESGVLEERVAGRDKLFVHRKLLALLTGDTNRFAPYD